MIVSALAMMTMVVTDDGGSQSVSQSVSQSPERVDGQVQGVCHAGEKQITVFAVLDIAWETVAITHANTVNKYVWMLDVQFRRWSEYLWWKGYTVKGVKSLDLQLVSILDRWTLDANGG